MPPPKDLRAGGIQDKHPVGRLSLGVRPLLLCLLDNCLNFPRGGSDEADVRKNKFRALRVWGVTVEMKEGIGFAVAGSRAI